MAKHARIHSLLRSATLWVFLLTFAVYRFSPLSELADSTYAFLQSSHLLRNGNVFIEEYFELPLERHAYPGAYDKGPDEPLPPHIVEAKGHLLYWYPPGTSLLWLPYVGLRMALGEDVITDAHRYDWPSELRLQRDLAALVMAGAVAALFLAARCFLGVGPSLFIALATAFGTAYWSIASRVMWSHTTGLLLLSFIILHLARVESGRGGLRPGLVATLLSWMYFVRPTFSTTILAVTAYVLLAHRKSFLPLAATGFAWLVAFVLFSVSTTGELLPSYYLETKEMGLDQAAVNALVHLISPSRGLLIFSPIVIAGLYPAIRFARRIPAPHLAGLAWAAAGLHFLTLVLWPMWGGYCYGSRLTIDILPWLALLAVLGAAAVPAPAFAGRAARVASWALVGLAMAWSFFCHARGAFDVRTSQWNVVPEALAADITRVMDWSNPQMLAGSVTNFPTYNAVRMPRGERVELGSAQADAYLAAGWSAPEGEHRWTDGAAAEIEFLVQIHRVPTQLTLSAAGFVYPGRFDRQRVHVLLNNRRVATWSLDGEPREYTAKLKRVRIGDNRLVLELPDAAAPAEHGVNEDIRKLALRGFWMQLD